MKRLLTILALGILLPTALVASEPRAHIDESLVKFVAAFNAGDGATVASLYSEDATLFPPGGSVSMAVLRFRLSGKALSIQE